MDGCSVAQCTLDFVKDSVEDSVKDFVKDSEKESLKNSVKDPQCGYTILTS
jgi:hypothetical protein